jgi:hypothetical protein
MTVNGQAYPLAQGQVLDDVYAAVVSAVQAGGNIVDVTVYGNRTVGVMASPGVPITFETTEVADEDRDDGDLDHPFESGFTTFDDLA